MSYYKDEGTTQEEPENHNELHLDSEEHKRLNGYHPLFFVLLDRASIYDNRYVIISV